MLRSSPKRRHLARTNPAYARLAREYHGKQLELAERLLLPKARAGERWAALRLLYLSSEAIGEGVAVNGAVADWLSDMLYRMSQGDSLEEAASVPKRPQGQKKEGDAARARGRRYHMAYEFGVRFEHEGMKEIAAQAEVGDLFGVKPATVESAWKEHRDRVRQDIELELRTLGKVSKISSPPDLADN